MQKKNNKITEVVTQKDNPRVEVRETKIGTCGNVIEERFIGISGNDLKEAYETYKKVRKDLK